MATQNDCIQCIHCDGINHAPIGSGEYELGCRPEKGQYYELVGSGNKAKSCPRFSMKEFFKRQKEKSSCQM